MSGGAGATPADLASEKVTRQRLLVEQDREDLGRTVQALAEKVDVPKRAREAVTSAKVRVRTAARRYNRTDAALAACGLSASAVALGSLLVWWRNRR